MRKTGVQIISEKDLDVENMNFYLKNKKINGHLGGFHFLATMKDASINILIPSCV